MTKLVAFAALAALAIGCGSAGGGTCDGLHGYVKRGPTMPVCRVGVPCTAPARGQAHLLARGKGRRDRDHERERLVPRRSPRRPLHGEHDGKG